MSVEQFIVWAKASWADAWSGPRPCFGVMYLRQTNDFIWHWLLTSKWCSIPVRKRAEFKVATLVYTRRRLEMLPSIPGLRLLIADACPTRLRSADTRTLLVSRTRTNLGDRALRAEGPRVWNYLPTDLRQPDLAYSRFRQLLKTFSFGLCRSSVLITVAILCTLQ